MTMVAALVVLIAPQAIAEGLKSEVSSMVGMTRNRDDTNLRRRATPRALDDDGSDDDTDGDGDGDGEEEQPEQPWSPLCGSACGTPVPFILGGFFLAWNAIMATTMISQCAVPISHGQHPNWILILFPHWYMGLVMPIWIAGAIVGAITALPYAFFVHKAAKKYEFGCTPPPAPTAAQLRNVVDRDGVHVSAGDEIEVKYCNTWHRATLVTLRGDQGTWSVRVGDCKHTRLGCWYGAQRLRQVGAARPDEEAAAVAAAENRKQAKRIEELEAQVKSLTEWQKKQERGRGRKQSPRQDQVVPVATAAAVVAFPEATPIPPPPGVAPVGYDGGAWGDGGNRVVPGTVVIAL